jgi:hypothetical protein
VTEIEVAEAKGIVRVVVKSKGLNED